MIPAARVVAVDTPHLPPGVRSLSGDSRGHWDGSTKFVVETTNFNRPRSGSRRTRGSNGRTRGIPITKTLHLVERFSLVDANTMIYQMTLDDPAMFARPWTVQIPFARDDRYQMFEYACAEGNQAIGNILRGARREERDAQK